MIWPTTGLVKDRIEPLNHYSSHCFGVIEGLPHGSVTDLAMAHDGQMLVATYGGLVAFDGHRFSEFIPGTNQRFPPMEASAVAVSEDGSIWVGTTTHGVYRFHEGNMTQWDRSSGLDSTDIYSIHPRGSEVFISTGYHPHIIRTDAEPALLHSDRDVSDGRFSGVVRGPDNSWMMASPTGLWQSDDEARWQLVKLEGDVELQSGFTSAYNSEQHGLLMAQKRDLVTVRNGRALLYAADLSDRDMVVREIIEDRRGDVWLATASQGVKRISSRGVESFDRLPSTQVATLLEDPDNGMWVGLSGGLCLLNSSAIKSIGGPQGLANEYIEFLTVDDRDRVYVVPFGTFTGMTRIVEDQVEVSPLTGSGIDGVNRIDAISIASDGTIWVVNNRHLSHYENATVTSVLPIESQPRAMLSDRNDRLWIGFTASGLFRLNEGQLYPVPLPAEKSSIRGLNEAVNGDLLVAAKTAAYRVNIKSASRIDLPLEEATCINEFVDGEIWVCGLGLWLKTDDGHFHFNESDGLAIGHTHAVIDDVEGNIWVTTNSGLFRASRADLDAVIAGADITPLFQRYDERDGMRNSEFNGGARGAVRSNDGRLWFAGQGGVTVVDPAALVTDSPELMPMIERLFVDDELIPDDGWNSISPNPQRSRLQFSSILLSDSPSLSFRYRLLPIEEEWQQADLRTVDYRNLASGDYRFEVAVRYRDNGWSDVSSRSMVVLPAWYETLWFRLGSLLTVAFLLIWIPLMRIRNLKVKERELEGLVATRTRSLIDANKRLVHISRTDDLTGVANRREFSDTIQDLCTDPMSRLSLVIVDVDDFKAYNDHYGHLAGDECLKQIATLLDNSTSDEVLVARFGGEEFVLLFQDMPMDQVRAVMTYCMKVLSEIAIEHEFTSTGDHVTISAGMADRTPGESANQLIQRADKALYSAKSSGKNRIEQS